MLLLPQTGPPGVNKVRGVSACGTEEEEAGPPYLKWAPGLPLPWGQHGQARHHAELTAF